MELLEGQKAVVKDRICGHEFRIGEIVRIIFAQESSYKCTGDDPRISWWLTNKELERFGDPDTSIKNEVE